MTLVIGLTAAGIVTLLTGLLSLRTDATNGYDITGGYGGRKPPGLHTSAYYTWRD